MTSDILIFNDRYSDNVGDGVIAECLEFGLRRLSPGTAVRTFDLGGRQAMGGGGDAPPMWRRMLRNGAPPRLRRMLSAHHVRTAFRAQVADAMRAAQAVVIGGGQLITGSSTFFAERIAVIAQEARRHGVPLHLHAVGVANPDGWCREAAALLSEALGGGQCRSITVRDAASAAHWGDAFRASRPPIAPDPALIAGDAFFGRRMSGHGGSGRHDGKGEAGSGERPFLPSRTGMGARRVGVSVIAPDVVRFFGDTHSAPSTPDIFVDMVVAVAARGDRPILFTNGSGEDQLFLSRVCDALASRVPGWRDLVEVADRPRSATALVGCIAGMDAVVAHRLHANIIAYALGIPNVALAWDGKLRSFQASVGREQWLLAGGGDVVRAVMPKLANALREGVDATIHARHVQICWDAMAALLKHIGLPAATEAASFASHRTARPHGLASIAPVPRAVPASAPTAL